MRIDINIVKIVQCFRGTKQKKNQNRTISRKCAYAYDLCYNKLLFTYSYRYIKRIPFISIEEIEMNGHKTYLMLMAITNIMRGYHSVRYIIDNI